MEHRAGNADRRLAPMIWFCIPFRLPGSKKEKELQFARSFMDPSPGEFGPAHLDPISKDSREGDVICVFPARAICIVEYYKTMVILKSENEALQACLVRLLNLGKVEYIVSFFQEV